MSSPYINRFLQPDTIIPDLSNPQSWNRYSYVTNRPVNFNDPSGHKACGDGEEYDCNGNTQDPNVDPYKLPQPPSDDDNGPSDDEDPDVILSGNDDQEYTPGFLEYCIHHTFDSSCAPVLPPQADCSLPILISTGGSTTPNGCYLSGSHIEYHLSEYNKWRLALDIAGMIGSIAPLVGLMVCTPVAAFTCAAIGEGINIAIAFTSMAYNATNGNLGNLSWDIVQVILPELVKGGSIIPFVGLYPNLADAVQISEDSKVVIDEYKPIYTPLPIP